MLVFPWAEPYISIARKLFESAPRREAAEDYLWTLLNSYDFVLIK